MCDTRRMKERAAAPSDKRHRFPPGVIGHAVWLYFRFALSYRDVEELLAERGVIVSSETIRRWCRKFGQGYANALRRRRPRPGDTWHLDTGPGTPYRHALPARRHRPPPPATGDPSGAATATRSSRARSACR